MPAQVVVLGSGYAGAGAIRSLEDELDGGAEITWISDRDYHLILHESHRCISNPAVQEKITIPVEDVKSPRTEFIETTVESVSTADRTVSLADGSTVEYDYLLVGIGSQTAFFGIEGLKEHAHTLKSLEDALAINENIAAAAQEATREDPGQVIVGGAGLTGIQVAGEAARYRDEHDAHLDIHLVEGLDEIFPGNDPSVQNALRKRLEARDVQIHTGEFISEVNSERIHIGEDSEMDYDVLVWAGGISGQEPLQDMDVDKDERNYRLKTEQTFQTDDERVFAIGDAALIDQPGEEPAPPTAQSAWQAAEVAGVNIARAIRGQPLKKWTFKDKGTVISVGEDAVAHDVAMLPFVDTFGGFPARTLKKAIAARWIATITDLSDAAAAWSDM